MSTYLLILRRQNPSSLQAQIVETQNRALNVLVVPAGTCGRSRERSRPRAVERLGGPYTFVEGLGSTV